MNVRNYVFIIISIFGKMKMLQSVCLLAKSASTLLRTSPPKCVVMTLHLSVTTPGFLFSIPGRHCGDARHGTAAAAVASAQLVGSRGARVREILLCTQENSSDLFLLSMVSYVDGTMPYEPKLSVDSMKNTPSYRERIFGVRELIFWNLV